MVHWCITDEKVRQFEVPLAFLPQKSRYIATMYRDAENAHWKTNPYACEIDEQLVDADTVLTIHLAPGGGQALRLSPATPERMAVFLQQQ